MLLLASKILITFATVILLASVAEKMGPRHAGILAGFPLGTAIALFFFGWQQGESFAAQSAVYTLAGLASAICLAWGYLKLLQLRVRFFPKAKSTPWIWMLPATCAGFSCFFASSWLLQFLPQNRWFSLMVILIAIIFFRRLFQSIPEQKIKSEIKNQQKSIRRNKLKTLVFRASVATLSILLITGLAELLGPARAGLLAAFPVSFFPLILILHISHGEKVLATTIKHYPDGLGALVVYCLGISFLYPAFGIGWGTLGSLLLSCVYLLVYSNVTPSKR